MTRAIRPSTPADAEAIVALLAQAGLRPGIEPRQLHWRYWQPRADWPGPRSYVLTEGSELIAHGALVPGVWLCESRRIRAIHVIDWAARSSAVGAGAVLMKHIAQQADALFAVGGSAQTMKMLPNLGFRAAGEMRGYVRTLHPLRLVQGTGMGRLRGLYHAARGLARTLAAPGGPDNGWFARRLPAGNLAEVRAVLPGLRPGIALAERSTGLFAFALECPIVAMSLYLVERGGCARGYFLLASAPGQVRIADCWMDSEAPNDWRALLGHAVAEARRDAQAAEIVGWANDALTSSALEACGFRACHANTIQVRPVPGALLPTEPLRVQMLDSDAAYLHDGRREFWS
jgi:hypothetical protein